MHHFTNVFRDSYLIESPAEGPRQCTHKYFLFYINVKTIRRPIKKVCKCFLFKDPQIQCVFRRICNFHQKHVVTFIYKLSKLHLQTSCSLRTLDGWTERVCSCVWNCVCDSPDGSWITNALFFFNRESSVASRMSPSLFDLVSPGLLCPTSHRPPTTWLPDCLPSFKGKPAERLESVTWLHILISHRLAVRCHAITVPQQSTQQYSKQPL